MSLLTDALTIIDASSDPTVKAIAGVLRSTSIESGHLPHGAYASYLPVERRIVVSNGAYMTGIDATELAATLVHEGRHALDDSRGELPTAPMTDREYLEPEERAVETEAEFWQSSGHPAHNDVSSMEADKVLQLEWGTLKLKTDMVYLSSALSR